MTAVANPHAVKAVYWEKFPDGSIKCHLCPWHCKVKEGKAGICGVKENVEGELIATAYGLTTSFAMDPIEKKPLYHFHPGTEILSVGLNACNLKCDFCQNYLVSQEKAPTRYISPEELVSAAQKTGSIGIAYTYTEPLMWYEYIVDSARMMKEAGLKTVLVTNGCIEEQPFRELLPLIDALNIDVKSMEPRFYAKICHGKLEPVLKMVEMAARSAHVEITNLVIPTQNDSDANFEKLADFIAGIDPYIPLHFSRYHPAYKMTIPATPVDTLSRAARIAAEKLKYVFVGNVHLPEWQNSYCPHCDALLVAREGYFGGNPVGVKKGCCASCGNEVKIVSE